MTLFAVTQKTRRVLSEWRAKLPKSMQNGLWRQTPQAILRFPLR